VIGTGYASGEEALAHFGLGKTERCDLEVRWREHRLIRRDVSAKQVIHRG
ncbi:MAG: ASPIC/UnbV domain-containing protein, partial [Deltaproteobacteria bacterium]|nr:ASPIC/UnbV domain-containing protein [Deltaproteobacteria bacterium]